VDFLKEALFTIRSTTSEAAEAMVTVCESPAIAKSRNGRRPQTSTLENVTFAHKPDRQGATTS
jgi:hypothetical protein